MAAGYLVFHGPRAMVPDFFEALGFRCPERKGEADFLQEVTSRRDQAVRCASMLLADSPCMQKPFCCCAIGDQSRHAPTGYLKEGIK